MTTALFLSRVHWIWRSRPRCYRYALNTKNARVSYHVTRIPRRELPVGCPRVESLLVGIQLEWIPLSDRCPCAFHSLLHRTGLAQGGFIVVLHSARGNEGEGVEDAPLSKGVPQDAGPLACACTGTVKGLGPQWGPGRNSESTPWVGPRGSGPRESGPWTEPWIRRMKR